ncbi:MAG: hypothetical protein KJ906_02130 [Nanoarchaeota archaeon]|nr:hypothetical protein [Nanoarchaeota archaeon]
MEEIHNTKRKLSTQIKRIKESNTLSKKNKDIILKFYDECYSQGLSDMRVLYYIIKLWKLSQWISKDFNKLNKDDIKIKKEKHILLRVMREFSEPAEMIMKKGTTILRQKSFIIDVVTKEYFEHFLKKYYSKLSLI